ncbi:unnamed protein product [Agarophyton chilense]
MSPTPTPSNTPNAILIAMLTRIASVTLKAALAFQSITVIARRNPPTIPLTVPASLVDTWFACIMYPTLVAATKARNPVDNATTRRFVRLEDVVTGNMSPSPHTFRMHGKLRNIARDAAPTKLVATAKVTIEFSTRNVFFAKKSPQYS